MVSAAIEIPEKTFVRPNRGLDERNLSFRITFSSAEHLVRKTADLCGISVLQLGWLVGLPNPNKIYDWTGGHHRPSAVYQSRLHKIALLELEHPGKVFWMKTIDWYTGQIAWKEGYKVQSSQPATPGSMEAINNA